MSLRLEMLQVARLAPTLLRDAAPLVVEFLRSRLNPDGGFADRAGASDLYYTVFGLEGLHALRAEIPSARVKVFLDTFRDPETMDLVHLASLARCWAALPELGMEPGLREALNLKLESFRSQDGGFHTVPASKSCSPYACFLAIGAFQDLKVEPPRLNDTGRALRQLFCRDGEELDSGRPEEPATPVIAAVVTLLRHLGEPVSDTLKESLLTRRHSQGGFLASAEAPLPDLLSTATALHALVGIHEPLDAFKEPCLDFVDSLWTNRGGFYGHWADDELDAEYTYYGLLALGHLSL